VDQISGLKQQPCPRERVVELFYEGSALLEAMMNNIDENKLRK
jgi:hypothetical protein